MAEFIALYSSTMHCGKTEVATVLTQEFGFRTVKCAKTLKSMIVTLLVDLGIPISEIPRYIEGDLKEKLIPQLGVSPRWMFETLGTKWGRELIHPDLWATLAASRVKAELAQGHSVVVDDMRFPNEFEAFERLGGVLVRVSRPGHLATPGSISEGRLDDVLFPYEVVNAGTLDELAESTRTLVQTVRL